MTKCSRCEASAELYANGVPFCVNCGAVVEVVCEYKQDRERILEILRRELKIAKKRSVEASTHFTEMIHQAPSGIPYPDGTERIHRASRDYSHSQDRLRDALARMNDYLLQGKIPPGIGNPADKDS